MRVYSKKYKSQCCVALSDQLDFNIIEKEKVASVQHPLLEALQLHLSRTRQRPLQVFTRAMTVLAEIKKSRMMVQQGRQDAQGFLSRIGLQVTPLMKAIVTKREVTYLHKKHHLLQAVMDT